MSESERRASVQDVAGGERGADLRVVSSRADDDRSDDAGWGDEWGGGSPLSQLEGEQDFERASQGSPDAGLAPPPVHAPVMRAGASDGTGDSDADSSRGADDSDADWSDEEGGGASGSGDGMAHGELQAHGHASAADITPSAQSPALSPPPQVAGVQRSDEPEAPASDGASDDGSDDSGANDGGDGSDATNGSDGGDVSEGGDSSSGDDDGADSAVSHGSGQGNAPPSVSPLPSPPPARRADAMDDDGLLEPGATRGARILYNVFEHPHAWAPDAKDTDADAVITLDTRPPSASSVQRRRRGRLGRVFGCSR